MNYSDSDTENGKQWEEQIRDVKKALNEINKYTGNSFSCIKDCVQYVKILYDNSKRNARRESYRDDTRSQYNEKIEDLELEIENLVSKLKSSERKFKKKLEEKDCEIEELTEELESMQNKTPKDLKCKSQFKKLQETITSLEDQLESKDDEIKSIIKKHKDMVKNYDTMEEENIRLKKEIENLKNQMKKDIVAFTETIKEKEKDLQEDIAVLTETNKDKEKYLQDKQSAIEIIKQKLLHEKGENERLNSEMAQLIVNLSECKANLHNEKFKTNELENKNTCNEIKIKHLEKEIHIARVNKFQNKESWHPIWWNHYKGENKFSNTIQIECTICKTMHNVNKIKDHIERCKNNNPFY